MPDGPRPRNNPRAITPDRDPSLHPNPAPELSLVEDLGPVADDLRQLFTDFGTRPYRVFSVVVFWTGGEEGRGEETVESETEFLPTPLVDLSRLRSVTTSAGKTEKGFHVMTEVSPRYTEDDIRTLFHVQPLPKGRTGYIEIQMDRRDAQAKRRRFAVRGVPARRADEFDFRVSLSVQDQARLRSGQPDRPPKAF